MGVSASGAEGFRTMTFGNSQRCEVQGTLRADEGSIRFDLSALPPGTKVWRAVLRVSAEGREHGTPVRLVPADLAGANALRLRPPLYDCFDATACVRSWVARSTSNKGLKIAQSGGLRFGDAVLEVSFADSVVEPIPPVSELHAFHQCGQTFLTWREIEDPVADDAPRFEDFEKRVLERSQPSLRRASASGTVAFSRPRRSKNTISFLFSRVNSISRAKSSISASTNSRPSGARSTRFSSPACRSNPFRTRDRELTWTVFIIETPCHEQAPCSPTYNFFRFRVSTTGSSANCC
jgi:hypothetical protein